MKKKKKKTKKKVKVTRRSKAKNAALDPKYTLKSRLELLDFDYLDRLNAKDLAWLNKFSDEFTHNNLDRKNLKNNLHNTPELKKSCDDANNARNSDILTRKKTRKMLDYVSDNELERIEVNPEDYIIEMIDRKKS